MDDQSRNDDNDRRAVVGELDDDDGSAIVKTESTALEAITRSEISMQLEAAHRFPRSVTRFLREATGLATLTREVAESCLYSLPRGDKNITGPSVRLAEIIASTWGNLQVGSRVLGLDPDETVVIAQAVAWDMQRNLRLTAEAQRGILYAPPKGKIIPIANRRRYDADMIRVTGMAAMAIARRNVIFQVVPRSYVDTLYDEARRAAVGDAKTLATRRDEWIERFAKMGVTVDRVYARLGIRGKEDITIDHGATLIGLANAIKRGEVDVDEAFPPVPVASLGGTPATSSAPAQSAQPTTPAAAAAQSAPEGRRVNVGTGKRGRPPAAEQSAAAPSGPSSNASGPPPETAKNPPAAEPSNASSTTGPRQVAPPPAPGTDPVALVLALAVIDEAWKAGNARAIVDGWTETQRAEAYAWTQHVLNNTGTMAEQMGRPSFTNIDGPPDDVVDLGEIGGSQ